LQEEEEEEEEDEEEEEIYLRRKEQELGFSGTWERLHFLGCSGRMEISNGGTRRKV
jgi:hypothetical protein